MGHIKVAVSPFFGGEDWVDEYTGIKFEKHARGLNVYSIPDNFNLTGIKRSIRLNSLMLVEGDPSLFNEVNEVVIPTPEAPAPEITIPEEVVVGDDIVGEPVIVEEEAPKKKSAKKKSK